MSGKPHQEGRVAKKKAAGHETPEFPETMELPLEEVLELEEEMAASGRSRASIIAEALLIRRKALEAIGVEVETTMTTDLSQLVVRHCRAGAKVLGHMEKEKKTKRST